jgi:hypothetical protein
VGGQNRLALDTHCPAWRFQHESDVLADRLQVGQPWRLDDTRRHEIAVAIAQTSPSEVVLVVADLQRPRRTEQLLVARAIPTDQCSTLSWPR